MYPYLENGTLKDKLNELDGQERLKIMKSIAIGKKHAFKRYDQFALNTSCFWGSKYWIKFRNFIKILFQK